MVVFYRKSFIFSKKKKDVLGPILSKGTDEFVVNVICSFHFYERTKEPLRVIYPLTRFFILLSPLFDLNPTENKYGLW